MVREVTPSRRKLDRADERVLGEPFVQLGELLELGVVGAERALAGFTGGEKLAREPAAVRGAAGLERAGEDAAFERPARFVLGVEHRIARDEKRVLAGAELSIRLAGRALEHVKGFVGRRADDRRDAVRALHGDLRGVAAPQLGWEPRAGRIGEWMPAD